MSSLTQCFFEAIPSRIIILKPDYEFLMWELPTEERKHFPSHQEALNPFQLFRKHYLEAMYKPYRNDDAEIIEAWCCSDKQVHEVYGNICSQMRLRYFNPFELEHKLLNKIKLNKFDRKNYGIVRHNLGSEYKEAAYRKLTVGIVGNKRLINVIYQLKITVVFADGKMILGLIELEVPILPTILDLKILVVVIALSMFERL
ncbi:15677_t:CDS:2 [Funneliformis geosporum]|uniref:16488_t:CDS:1 n=1 Tax=Funneliformis geosporum TaxID=1117311 RepID=A0A9W4WXA0_9GLOM|nr:15677_t:CDS:2 [Funneliformis geosporum]CAI2179097.1 16488_t:CDS:2 [Funneliformis geosporum]